MSAETPTYRRIEGWPANCAELASRELPSLVQIWRERREQMGAGGQLEQFLVRLRREWAIETGLIERLYAWDRGVTETLIEHGIDAAVITSRTNYDRSKADRVRNQILDQQNVVEELFRFVKEGGVLTEHYIRGCHDQFTLHQETTEAYSAIEKRMVEVPLLRGEYKKLPNNPRRRDGTLHAYCPPELVRDEMEFLVRWYDQRPTDCAPEVAAAWLHHRFTQIHPFQDGNGRVARALATLVLLKADLFPLVLRESDRNAYIDALEKADTGDLAPLVELFVTRQRAALFAAIDGVSETLASSSMEAAREHALSRFEALRRNQTESERRSGVLAVADSLAQQAYTILGGEAEKLSARLQALGTATKRGVKYGATALRPKRPEQARAQQDFVSVAARLEGATILASVPSRVVVLRIDSDSGFEIGVDIHAVGKSFHGVMRALGYSCRIAYSSPSEFSRAYYEPACRRAFNFNYNEDPNKVSERFTSWVEEVLAVGLASWARALDELL